LEHITEEQKKKAEIKLKKFKVKETLCCPYCDEKLKKWTVPQTPFTQWPNEFLYVCFNDECGYFKRGWDVLSGQGMQGTYRFMFNPDTGGCLSAPVLNQTAMTDGILEE
jgi:hypothetical protein